MMSKKFTTSEIISMAWNDKTSFDYIKKITNLTEPEVIKIMRKNLKTSSFEMWRKRVSGRITKHGKRLKSYLVDNNLTKVSSNTNKS